MKQTSAFFILLFVVLGSSHAQSPEPIRYLDSEEGLRQFLSDFVTAIRAKDDKKASQLAKSTLIPNADEWFHRVFGDKDADRLSQNYRSRDFIEAVRAQFTGFARRKEPLQFMALKYGDVQTPTDDKWVNVTLASMKQATAIYKAGYQVGSAKEPYSLEYFFYIDGGFRFVDLPLLSLIDGAPPIRIRVGGDVQVAKSIRQSPPIYSEEARKQKVQGAVLLQITIGRDGLVTNAEAVSGHPLLVPMAIEAVKRWQYKPTLLNGAPVEVVTVVQVVFTLSK
ncbi:MAG: energy transducer TonB [Acidobacteria bacterium]|nr:energy transducer TonB [Acidobacteriota bacterium]